jgi:hypothetical protein
LGYIICAIDSLGISVAAIHVEARNLSAKQLNAAIDRAVDSGYLHLISDVCRIALELGCEITKQVYVKGIFIPEVEFSSKSGKAALLYFQDCFFERVGIEPNVAKEYLPRFQRCYIGELDGRVSRADLPVDTFDDECEIDKFVIAGETTNEILSLDLPMGTKVLLTVLKKLYQRRGSGRKESALHRGLDHRARRIVPDVLKLLEAQGVAVRYRRGDAMVWLPDRGATKRVGRIVASPTASKDPLVVASATLE